MSPNPTEVAARASQAGKACQAAGATKNGGGSRQQLVLQGVATVAESYEHAYDYERRRYGGNRGSALRLKPEVRPKQVAGANAPTVQFRECLRTMQHVSDRQ